jgi:hypothetical protein
MRKRRMERAKRKCSKRGMGETGTQRSSSNDIEDGER